jgi:6-phosphogluconolactonase
VDHNDGRHLVVCVGCYSQPVPHALEAHGDGLQILDIELSTGLATPLLEYGSLANPAFVCAHPSLPVVYVLSEVWTGPGTVCSLRLTPDRRTLLGRADLPSYGDMPAYASVVDSFLLVGNYGDGSLVSYRLHANGDLAEQVSLVALSGSGPDLDRQLGPHAHCLLAHPSNGFVYAADLGADLVLRLSLDRSTGAFAVVGSTRVPPGSGPRHLAFTPSGATAFLVEELSSTVTVFGVETGGELVARQRLSMLPPDTAQPSSGADIVVSPTGDRVYASNRGHDSVVTYAPGRDGSWEAREWTPTGGVPRGLALSPDGGTLLVANQAGDSLGLLEVTPQGLVERFRLSVATPTCVRVLG